MRYFIFYLIAVNILSSIITIHDKRAAIHGNWRVKEKTLLLFSSLGGAPLMLLTMLLIRHKTCKPLFMIGIPVIFFLELLVFYLVNTYVVKII